jgi:DNA mismatch repair protein MutL
MASCIQILGENIANQIAAGEVVERPASVVKELIENALDAKANQIDVSIEEGGLSRIVVSDNGDGMSPEDAVLCFARHATSKIKDAHDLEAILTFGFRGEALAAISSVSKVTLVTRQKHAEAATQVVVEGSQIKHVGPVRGVFGTRIEIDDLFFNTPARLKFLRSAKSEAAQIDDMVRDVALAQPGVAFSLRQQAQVKIDASGVSTDLPLADPRKMQRAAQLLGEESQGNLYVIDVPMTDARLVGYVASPLISRRDNKGIRLFVNGRVVQDRTLSMAVQIAYRTLLEIGRKPICALNIEIDPRLVDVNVHPTKAEVRFQEELGMQSQIIRALQSFLATTPWLAKSTAKSYMLRTAEPFAATTAPSMSFDEPVSFGTVGWNLQAQEVEAPKFEQIALTPEKKRFFHELRVLGQVDQTYLVLDDGSGLVLVDQHAAHERVFFERFRSGFAERVLKGQPLLFPKQVRLSSAEVQALAAQREFLLGFGFDVEPFGDDVAIMRAIPPELRESEAESMLKDFLADVSRNKVSTSLADWIDKICAQMACHGSIRAGQALSHDQINALLKQLDTIDYSAHCPHGRPTTKVVPYTELAKWFHRL